MSAIASQTTSLTIVYRLSKAQIKETSKHVTGLCEGNSTVTGEFPAHRAMKMFPFDDFIMIEAPAIITDWAKYQICVVW